MLNIKELKNEPVKSEGDVVYKYVVTTMESLLAKDEWIICDRGGVWPHTGVISDYRNFYYSHLCRGGCFNHLLSLYLPQPYDRDFDGDIKVSPAHGYGDNRHFSVADPEATELKSFMRKIMDGIKKYQNRKEYTWPWTTNPSESGKDS